VWAGDLTYVWTVEGWLYLDVLLDLYSRRGDGRENRTPSAGLAHHSDRGSQGEGNCWDNACVESFCGTLKRELVYHRHYVTRYEAKRDIFE